jgi:hypothetical protein
LSDADWTYRYALYGSLAEPLKGSWATYPHARTLFHIMRSVATKLRIVLELQWQPETSACSLWPSKSLSAQLPKSLRIHFRN